MSECECAAAGWCERYQRKQSCRAFEICSGQALTPEKQEQYRQLWARMRDANGPEQRPEPQPAPLPCIHRGEQIEQIDCGCNGAMFTYVCGSQQNADRQCTLRKIERKAGKPRITLPNCLDCPWRQ